MKIKSHPLTESFTLASDPEGVAIVTVRQAREGENIERAELFSKTTREYGDEIIGRVRLQTEFNQKRLRRTEAYLTLGSVVGVTDENGTELFRSGETVDGKSVKAAMSESEFNLKWAKLDPEVVAEITECIFTVNPTWNPDRQGE